MSSGTMGDSSSNLTDYNPDVDSSDSDSSDSPPPSGNFNCMDSGYDPNACSSEGCKGDSDVETDNGTGCFESCTSNNGSSYNPQPLTKTKMGVSEMQKLHPEMEEVTSRSSPECFEGGEIHESRKSVLSSLSSSGESLPSPKVENGGNETDKSFLATAVQEIRSYQCISEDHLLEKECIQRESGTDVISEDLNAFVKVPCDGSSCSSVESSVECPSNATQEIQGQGFSMTDSSSSSSVTGSAYEDPVVEHASIRLSPNVHSANESTVTKHSEIRTDEATQFQNAATNKLMESVSSIKTLSFKERFYNNNQKTVVKTQSLGTTEPSNIRSGQDSSYQGSKNDLSIICSKPEMRRHPYDKDHSTPASATEPVLDSVRPVGFRSIFGLELKVNPIGNSVKHVLPSREVIRPALTEQDFMDMLDQKLRNLTTQQLVEQSIEKFFPDLSSVILPPALSFADFRSLLENSFGYLKSNAIFWEKLFGDHICLPDNLMKTHLEQYRNLMSQTPQDLPSNLRTIVKLRIEAYAKEYTARNAEIQRREETALELLTRKAASYYAEEMKYILGNNSFDPEILTNFHDEICQETQCIFLSSAAFKHEHWENMYKGILAEKIDRERQIYMVLNNNNRRFLYSDLQRIKEDCVNYYKISVDAEKAKREFNPKSSMAPATFNKVGAVAHEDATKFFEKEIDLKIGNQNKNIIRSYWEQFQKDINRLFNTEQKEILEIQRQEEERLKEKELVMQKVKSKPEAPESKSRGGGGGNQLPAEASKNVERGCSAPSGLPTALAIPLPNFHLAIHFGLNRTYAGIYLPGTDTFKLLANVQNNLYFEHGDLLAHGVENLPGHGVGTSFKSFILDHPTNKTHDIQIYDKHYQFRIEDFISFLFANLKWRAERYLLATCPNCVVCVPQCLNDLQRQAIKDGTTLAGFSDAKVINDTNAIAFAYKMQNRFHVGDIVAVNTSEGFIDAAYFALDNGFIIRKAISGKYFTAEVEPKFYTVSYWSKNRAFQEKVKNALKFKLERKNEKAIQCDSSYLVVIGSGEDANKVASVMDGSFRKTVCLDEEFPVLGAAALARLQDVKFRKCDDPICKVWLEYNPSDKLSERIQKFKGYLLSPGTTCNTAFLNNPTTTKGINLNVGVIQSKMRNFFLQESQELHLVTMDILRYAINLKSQIFEAHGQSDVKIQFLQRIAQIITEIQNCWKSVEFTKNLKEELRCIEQSFFGVTT